MKDSYTLDRDSEGLDAAYALHEVAYGRIFDRCGLTYWKVESDTGYMGGSGAHEYMAPSSAGEDEVALCDRCDYAANVEKARSRISQPEFPPDAPPEEVATPGVETIDALAEFLGVDPRATAKAMPVVAADGTVVLALVRGDRRGSTRLKLRKALGQDHRPATRGDRGGVWREASSIGPVGVDTTIIADRFLANGAYVGGANRTGYHITGLVLGRDYQAQLPTCTSSRRATTARCAAGRCASSRRSRSATSSSSGRSTPEALGATYLDEGGEERPIVMGSYGIGPPASSRRRSSSRTTTQGASGPRRSPRSTRGSS
jgi:prolyl-tRNA synthetase